MFKTRFDDCFMFEIFGKQIGKHSRSAIGVAGLPMNFAIEIEGELEIE